MWCSMHITFFDVQIVMYIIGCLIDAVKKFGRMSAVTDWVFGTLMLYEIQCNFY